jgi:hypothetical protein
MSSLLKLGSIPLTLANPLAEPVVVMPDFFRGKPWSLDKSLPSFSPVFSL